ncbi:MAG: hypothetical protein ACE5DN_02890, partial [Flavobacteriales bacterium]
HKISRNIWVGESCVFISEIERFPGLQLEARIDDKTLQINAYLSNDNQEVNMLNALYLRTGQNPMCISALCCSPALSRWQISR